MKPRTLVLLPAAIYWVLYWHDPSKWLRLATALALTLLWAALAIQARKH